MNTAVEVAVTGQYGGGVQVAVDDFLLNHRVQRAGHTVTGSTGEGHNAKAQLFQFRQQARFFQVQLGHFGARRERRLHPGLTDQAQFVGFFRQQPRRYHVARVGRVGTGGNGGNDHRTIGHQALSFLRLGCVQIDGNAFGFQISGRQTGVRVGRASHVAANAGQVEAQHALVLRGCQRIRPQASLFGVLFHQGDLLRLTAGQFQVIDGLFVDVEHGRRRAVFRCHVGDGGTVTDGQAGRTLTEELDIGTHHALFAQEFGQCQHDVGGSNARLTLAGQLDTHDIRKTHHGRMAEHHGFRFQTAHTHGNNAQRIDVRGVRIGTDAGIREGHAVLHLNHRRHFLQVDLVHDAVTGRNHVDVIERGFGPVNKVETVFVAAFFDVTVFLERVRIETAAFNGQRVVDDQLGLYHRVYFRRVTAFGRDGVTQAGQIHQRGLAENVVAHHTGRIPGKIQVTFALDQLG